MGLRGQIFGPERTDLGLDRADLGAERGGGGGGTDVWNSGNSPLCPIGHRPFGAAAQKGEKEKKKKFTKRNKEIGNKFFFSVLISFCTCYCF